MRTSRADAQPEGHGAGGETVIKVRDDGPYKVSGNVRLIDAGGDEWNLPLGEAIALCRCGQSATKPFCDGSHRLAGFQGCERASASR